MPKLVGNTLLNRYTVQEFISRGGFAEVFTVWDNERATYLALKLLREDLAHDRIFLRRFLREAQTLEKLQHPNIVRSYGLERECLLAFMLMDYVEGTSLRTEIFALDGQVISSQRIWEIMQPTCSALHYAHNMGNDGSFISFKINPASVDIYGRHACQAHEYPEGQDYPILSGVQYTWDE